MRDSVAAPEEAVEETAGRLLAERGLTIACAESCTGGLLTSRLTDIAGSSAYVRGAVVSYTNEVKAGVLGVRQETLDAHTAVSEPTAREMAENVRRLLQTDIGVSITGLAGPAGAPGQPVGLVYIGIAVPSGTRVTENRFAGSRKEIKWQASQRALEMVLHALFRWHC
ncbi:MAG: nicotinamide-nucleotide amidohydrolase family protein [Schwartzia sp.]|nr:nicotinamide-nucleotide amidohydrolase family protein [Schwartzia sp. (in: firmicutes)]